MSEPHPLDAGTRLEVARDGALLVTLDREWWGDRAPHGGFLAALMLRALKTTVDTGSRPVRSLMVHFVDAATEGVATLMPIVEREGRSLTTTSLRMTQGDRVIALATATFARARASFEFEDAVMPPVKPPEEIEPWPNVGDRLPPFLRHVEGRRAIGGLPFQAAEQAYVAGWLRLSQHRTLDDLALAFFMDIEVPTPWMKVTRFHGTPTVDYSIHFVRPLPLEDAAPDDHYLGVFRTDAALQGYYSEDGELYARDGRLIARSRQLALLIPVGD